MELLSGSTSGSITCDGGPTVLLSLGFFALVSQKICCPKRPIGLGYKMNTIYIISARVVARHFCCLTAGFSDMHEICVLVRSSCPRKRSRTSQSHIFPSFAHGEGGKMHTYFMPIYKCYPQIFGEPKD